VQTSEHNMEPLAPLMGAVARQLLGEPNNKLSKASRLRFGTHGAIEVDTVEGWFDDYEANVRGGVLKLIRHRGGVGCGCRRLPLDGRPGD
jgi:hypothetical protein